MSDKPAMVDVRGLAAYLNVSTDVVYDMVRKRRIPFVRIGRVYRFDTSRVVETLTCDTVPESTRAAAPPTVRRTRTAIGPHDWGDPRSSC